MKEVIETEIHKSRLELIDKISNENERDLLNHLITQESDVALTDRERDFQLSNRLPPVSRNDHM